jgi:gluconolactonase
VYVCDKALKAVLRIEPASGLCTDITSQPSGSSFTMPNYLAFAPNGNLYVSDSGRMGASDGRVIVLRPDGSLQVAGDGARGYTNGLAIAPDGDRIFIVETSRPGISTFDLRRDGGLGDERAFIHLPHTVPDGVAVTKDGRLVVACWRPDSLFLVDGERVSPLYEDWRGLTLSAPTNVCFYGVAMTELAVANRGATHLTHLSTDLEGAPVHSPFG